MLLNEPVHVAFHEDTWYVLHGTVCVVMDLFKANQGCVFFLNTSVEFLITFWKS